MEIPHTIEPPDRAALSCSNCGGAVSARTRHLRVRGSSIRVFCSSACEEGARLEREGHITPVPPRRPMPRLLGGALATASAAVGLFALGGGGGLSSEPAPDAGPAGSRVAEAPADETGHEAAPDAAPARFGPPWPPSEEDWQRVLARDSWIHPLRGPERRMPTHHGRVFRAGRPGQRPAECGHGHCGVDIGGREDWGEPVLAVRDGTVEYVRRRDHPNGGKFVRLSHKDGAVFTEYFHLAAIPDDLRRGDRVERGETIGLLGDTGIDNSAPHLHFTISVKPSTERPERFIDPEPLIALWPLKVPIDCERATVVSTSEPPGAVVGAR